MCRLIVISALIYIVEECLCLFKFSLDIYIYQSMIVSSGMTHVVAWVVGYVTELEQSMIAVAFPNLVARGFYNP
jgi:hypothetical protein